jgi:hypothetical protein
MINFTYNRKRELEIFDVFVKPNKSPEATAVILGELNNVHITENDLNGTFFQELFANIKKDWESIEENFYEKIGVFYGLDISSPPILTCYLTRLNKHPYNYESKDKWFAAPMFASPIERRKTIMHELVHYFQPVELPRDIKEAMPCILNDSKNFLMYGVDNGHGTDEENKWRKIIWDIYTKGGNFKDVMDVYNKTLISK